MSLMFISKIVHNISTSKKVYTGGDKLDNGLSWKDHAITRVLKSSFAGTALTAFIIQMSQFENNGAETWFSMEFGDSVKNLKAKVTKTKGKNIATLLAEQQKLMKETQKAIDSNTAGGPHQ